MKTGYREQARPSLDPVLSTSEELEIRLKRLKEQAEYLRPKVGSAFALEMKQIIRTCRDEPHEDNLVAFGSQIIDLSQVVGMEFTGVYVTFFLHYGHKMIVHMSDVLSLTSTEGMENYLRLLEEVEEVKTLWLSGTLRQR